MLEFFDPFRDMTTISVMMRLGLAFLCGGLIGAERELKRRSAGFRTHILICLGAALAPLTSQFLFIELGHFTDVGRLGAQVIAGIGFMGAGAIIVTRRHRVKGLTTAAGLWATAIVGLTFGSGYFEGGLLCTMLILISEIFFSRFEYRMLRNVPEINVYVEVDCHKALDRLLLMLRENKIKVLNLEITKKGDSEEPAASAICTLRLNKKHPVEQILLQMDAIEGVEAVEEL